ncbi:MAG: phage antirepressor protein [Acetobacterium sp. MES1]|nr:MAG: phage antirepressor protein [Acetobacterium sp. MES1]
MIFDGRQVEVFEYEGKVLFNPYHCGECLELSPEGVRKAITKMNENQVVKLSNSKVTDSNFRKLHNTGENFLTESGVYKLIFKSHKPDAEKFQDWVTDEVLPAIRKTGSYNQQPDGEYLLALAVLEANKMLEEKDNTIKVQEQLIGEMKPKVDYVDDILKNKSLIKISSIAKDYGMSGQEMNNLLHALKVQYKSGDQWLLYAKHQSSGFTSSETVSFTRTDGRTDVKLITKWTQKGRLFLYELLKKQGVVPVIER